MLADGWFNDKESLVVDGVMIMNVVLIRRIDTNLLLSDAYRWCGIDKFVFGVGALYLPQSQDDHDQGVANAKTLV